MTNENSGAFRLGQIAFINVGRIPIIASMFPSKFPRHHGPILIWPVTADRVADSTPIVQTNAPVTL
jgi:hypothetical protein